MCYYTFTAGANGRNLENQKRRENKMTKFETKQVETIRAHVAIGNVESAALGLSSLIRCARTARSMAELMAVAHELNLRNHPQFRV